MYFKLRLDIDRRQRLQIVLRAVQATMRRYHPMKVSKSFRNFDLKMSKDFTLTDLLDHRKKIRQDACSIASRQSKDSNQIEITLRRITML